MAEYIERDAAAAIADYAVDEHPYDKDRARPETYSNYNQGWNDACDYIRGKLEAMPVTDGASVRHGRWDDEHRCTVCHNEAFYKISNIRPVYDYDWEENLVKTGDYIWDTEWFETTYCPYCGAQMDEKED